MLVVWRWWVLLWSRRTLAPTATRYSGVEFKVLPGQRTSILAASASSVAILKLDASLNHAPGRLLAMARTRVRERSAEVGTLAALKSYEGRGMG